jgi:hypothetical protein
MSEAPTENAIHLHLEDYPETLRLLSTLLDRRRDYERLGYRPTEHGAWVDWGHLTVEAPLSSTQIATVHIARGCAGLERARGAGPLAQAIIEAVTAATR